MSRLTDCAKCGNLYIAVRESDVLDPSRLCPSCAALHKLIGIADELVKWHATVDVVSGSVAADQLRGICDRAYAAANEARSL